jgi:guanine deaminase
MTTRERDEHWLQLAVDLAVHNVAEGGGPFGAVVVHDGVLVATGSNRVTATNDPTAHAEVMAIRATGAARADFRLNGCVLYSSCEPCPMCLAAAMWARLDRVVHAADREDAARAGFDDEVFHDLVGGEDPGEWPMSVQQLPLPAATAPFEAWLRHTDRNPY